MTSIVCGAIAVLIAFLGVFLYVAARLFRQRRAPEIDARWLAEFSPARYRPMQCLLEEEDIEFLAAQPGYTSSLGRRFRGQRRKVFLAYLRNLSRDFERLHRAARVLLLSAPEDRPDYAAALVRQRISFERALLVVRCRLLLNGVSGSAPDVSGLVDALEAMNAQVRTLAAAPFAA